MSSGLHKTSRHQLGIQQSVQKQLGAGADIHGRLHLQHWIWNYQLGYTLHPTIPIPLGAPLRIADVAAGNGRVVVRLLVHDYDH